MRNTVVIGAGLGGLSAAIHLRLAGHRVTIYEADPLPGGRANLLVRDGFRFDTGPSLLNYPWVFEQLFRAAGRNLYDYVTLLPVEPSVAFQWRDGARIQLSSDQAFLANQLAPYESNAAARVARFFADAREKYRISFDSLACRNAAGFLPWIGALSPREILRTAVWRSVYGELSRFFESRYTREALGAYAMYLGGSPFQLPGLFTILPYGEMAHGLWLPKGGIYALVEAVEKLALELGVVIRTAAPVRRIVSNGAGVQGIELEDGAFIGADVVVSNVDVPTTLTRLMRRPVPRTKMTPGVVTFYWGVRGTPPNLGHHTIFLPDRYRHSFTQLMSEGKIPSDLPFYVSVPSATDPALAPPGHSCVFVLVPTPVLSQLGGISWTEATAAIRSQVLERLGLHGIHLKSSIVSETCYTPADWRRRFGLFDGSAFGAAHTLRQVGPFRAPNASPHVPGLFFTGSGTTPGAGMPMVVLSGKMTAEKVAAYVC